MKSVWKHVLAPLAVVLTTSFGAFADNFNHPPCDFSDAFYTANGISVTQLDLAPAQRFGLFRQFRITEKVTLQFRAEAFNFTNTPKFNNPGGNVSAPNRDANGNVLTDANGALRLNGFTEVTSTRADFPERQFRFGLRIGF